MRSDWPARRPFLLSINGRDDEAPSLACEDLPRQKVVLDTEPLNFKVKAQDDFGVKRVGMEWQGVESAVVKTPAKGEQIACRGRPRQGRRWRSAARSRPSRWASSRSRSTVRIFAEDYFPGRERVYSPPYILYVLNAEQHAIWLTEQLSKWHRQSLEVRDREMQLHETNKQLRDLPPDELDRPETRRQIENQAARRAGQRPAAVEPGRHRRRPGPAGHAEPRVRRRPPGEMGRDAPDPQGHLGHSHAVGGRPAQAGVQAPMAAASPQGKKTPDGRHGSRHAAQRPEG